MANETAIQIWPWDEATYVLRQALHTHYEAPFAYLLLGAQRALLVDTGTGDVDFADVIYPLVGERILVVAHTHAHADHVGGDAAFEGRPNTKIVGWSAREVRAFFSIRENAPASYALGGRTIEVLPVPGHHPTDVAFYDRRTGLLLT